MRIGRFAIILLMTLLSAACTRLPPAAAPSGGLSDASIALDEKMIKGWAVTDFPGSPGTVQVQDGVLLLPIGDDMTGVTWKGQSLPRINYEISLEARRLAGDDFFCGLTFPVADSHASFIAGGWGGELCGISSLDGEDAAHNETCTNIKFETGRWYKIAVRVVPNHIIVRLDGEEIINASTQGRSIGVRWEVEPSQPLGIATWRTTGAIRNVQIQTLNP
jgi:hypothetical protein